jgi:hypothetical protein
VRVRVCLRFLNSLNRAGADIVELTGDSMLIFLNQDKTSESSGTLTLRAAQLACKLRSWIAAVNSAKLTLPSDVVESSSSSSSGAKFRSASFGNDADDSDEGLANSALTDTTGASKSSSSPSLPTSASRLPTSNAKVPTQPVGNVASATQVVVTHNVIKRATFGVAAGSATAFFVGGITGQWVFLVRAGGVFARVHAEAQRVCARAQVGGAPVRRAQMCAAAPETAGSVIFEESEWDAVRQLAPNVTTRTVHAQPFELCSLLSDVTAHVSNPIGIATPSDELSARLQRRLDQLPEIESALVAHVSPTVVDRLRNGDSAWLNQVRSVTAIALRFTGLRFDEAHAGEVHAVVQMLQSLANHYGGALHQFQQDDNGATAFVVFGLPPVQLENFPTQAVDLALHVLLALGNGAIYVEARAGVATGRVMMATVGSSLRKAFCLFGSTLRESAALARLTSAHTVLCDDATARGLSGFVLERQCDRGTTSRARACHRVRRVVATRPTRARAATRQRSRSPPPPLLLRRRRRRRRRTLADGSSRCRAHRRS